MEVRLRMGPPDEPWKTEVRLGFPEQRDGRPKQIFRLVDRRGDLYHERLWDTVTGEILREQKHRLSEHRGHGDDHSRPRR